MRSDRPAVEWYRDCIRQKQRRATSLTIDIDLNAHDKEDTGALAETIQRLDSAIEILEEADAIVMAASDSAAERMMDDLGHSMAPINFAEPQMSAAASRDAQQFFA